MKTDFLEALCLGQQKYKNIWRYERAHKTNEAVFIYSEVIRGGEERGGMKNYALIRCCNDSLLEALKQTVPRKEVS